MLSSSHFQKMINSKQEACCLLLVSESFHRFFLQYLPSEADLQCWTVSQFSPPVPPVALQHLDFFLSVSEWYYVRSWLHRRILSVFIIKPCISVCEQTSCRNTGTHWLAGRVQQWLPPTTEIPVWWRAAPSGLEGRSADRQWGPPSPSGCMPASCQTALEGPEEELCHFPCIVIQMN